MLQQRLTTIVAYCKLCQKVTDINKIDVFALDSHVKSKKQKDTVNTQISATPINAHFLSISHILVPFLIVGVNPLG